MIANPILIEKLRSDLAMGNKRLFGALATVEDFYGNRFPNMGMHEWNTLFNKINWNNPYPSLNIAMVSVDRHSSVRKKIQVLFPSGEIVKEKQVVKTLLSVVRYAGINEVYNLGIMTGNSPLITNEVNKKYAYAFKQVGDSLYVNTCSDTLTKFSQIKQINERLKLGLVVTLY